MSAQAAQHGKRSALVPHDWMIRVLEDLRAYARLNGLAALADELDQARMLAMTEIANLPPVEDHRDESAG